MLKRCLNLPKPRAESKCRLLPYPPKPLALWSASRQSCQPRSVAETWPWFLIKTLSALSFNRKLLLFHADACADALIRNYARNVAGVAHVENHDWQVIVHA